MSVVRFAPGRLVRWTAAASLTLAGALAGTLAATPAAAANLTPTWSAAPGGFVDGVALADVNGDSRFEILLTSRGGAYAPGAVTPGVGSLTLLDEDGNELWQVQTGQDIFGYPAAGDLDGDGLDEFAFCEHGFTAYCYAYDGDGTQMFRVGPLWYPAMSNGGPAIADLNGDGFEDVVFTSFGGQVTAFAGPMGTELWRVDLWNDPQYRVQVLLNGNPVMEGDNLFGHPAIADLDADGDLEVILGGNNLGGLYAFDGATGNQEWFHSRVGDLAANPTPGNQLYFYGTGPMVADLDGDDEGEVVALMVGTAVTSIVAFEHDGSVKWWREFSSGTFDFISPVATDGDGDDTPEIYLMGSDAVAYELSAADGSTLRQGTLGSWSWSSPAMADITNDGIPEILYVTTSDLYVFDLTTGGVVHSYSNPGAGGLYPPPVITDMDSDGMAEILVGGWDPGEFYRFDLADKIGYKWPAFMGSKQHAGFLDSGDLESLLPEDPSPGLDTVVSHIETEQSQAPGGAQNELNAAVAEVEDGWEDYMEGNPHLAQRDLQDAIEELEDADDDGADTQAIQEMLAIMMIRIFEQYLDRTTSLVADGEADLVAAANDLADAKAELAAGDYDGAAEDAERGTQRVRNWLDGDYSPGNDTTNNCPGSPTHVYHEAECTLLEVLEGIQNASSNDYDLDRAESYLINGIAWAPDLVFSNSMYWFYYAVYYLERVSNPDTTQWQAEIAESTRQVARMYIDDVIVWRGAGNGDVADAEDQYDQGLDDLDAGNYRNAVAHFRSAYNEAAGGV